MLELGWQPDDPSKPFQKGDKNLKRHNILKMKMAKTGEIKEVIPASDWVEINFSDMALATVHKLFFSYYEKVPVKNQADYKKLIMK